MLSYKDYLNADYGFSTRTEFDKARECKPTGYALANNCEMNIVSRDGWYWTRSPASNGLPSAWDVRDAGDMLYFVNNESTHGVRPAITIKI